VVIGASLLVGLIVWGQWIGIFFLVAALALGMVFEFTEITYGMMDRREKRYVLLSMTWFICLLNAVSPQSEFALLIISFITLFGYFLSSAKRHDKAGLDLHFRELMASAFALIYLVFMPLFLIRIYEFSNGTEWTVLFFLIVWAGDTGAYFVGKKFGKKKLYPEVSPKKTIEGSVGGLGAGIVVAFLFKWVVFHKMSWPSVVCLPVVVGLFAQMGDLCESLLKRAFDKKDSGSILPGHGGFLDRFDSVIWSAPVMYTCIRIFG